MRATMNARSETIGQLVSFARHWKAGQLCLIPADAFFEPRYDDTGKSTRWRIGLADGEPFAIAGLWRTWSNGATSFTMPTVNADRHPFLQQFHKPGDEKRSVVILPPETWDDWLACRDPERARTFLRLLPPERLAGVPAPVPPRKRASALDGVQATLSAG
ncbi:SOS response associated peptidase (SRAP) [compost metagenome]